MTTAERPAAAARCSSAPTTAAHDEAEQHADEHGDQRCLHVFHCRSRYRQNRAGRLARPPRARCSSSPHRRTVPVWVGRARRGREGAGSGCDGADAEQVAGGDRRIQRAGVRGAVRAAGRERQGRARRGRLLRRTPRAGIPCGRRRLRHRACGHRAGPARAPRGGCRRRRLDARRGAQGSAGRHLDRGRPARRHRRSGGRTGRPRRPGRQRRGLPDARHRAAASHRTSPAGSPRAGCSSPASPRTGT